MIGAGNEAATGHPAGTAELGWIAPAAIPVTIDEIPRRGAERFGERIALAAGSAEVSYAELERRTAAVAGGLRLAGIGAGDRVALVLANSVDYLAAYFGVARAGAVALPIGTRLHPSEMRFLLDHSGAVAVIADAANRAAATEAAAGAAAILDLSDLLAATPTGAGSGREADDDAAIFYTSGTTAQPKGVRLTHRSIVHAAAVSGNAYRITADDVALALLPLYHTTTHFMPLPTLMAGGTVVPQEGFGAATVFDLLERHRVTLFPMVTAIGVLMAGHARETGRRPRLDSLRYLFVGGAAVPRSLISDWGEIAPATGIVNSYGLTEMGPPVAGLLPDVHAQREGSVGPPYEGIEVMIADPDGTPQAPGEVGEILTRGDSIMAGYWRNEEATAAAIRDGWLRTGDLGRQDEDGYLWIVGREKQMIKRGGENVFPNEVEDVLSRHPQVAEAQVVGVPDEVMGERVCAIVSAPAGVEVDDEGVIAYCREQMSDLKVPEYLVVLPGELPKNGIGKVDVRLLAERARGGALPLRDFRRGRARQRPSERGA
ncbi:MAG TPA: AMP-binding protein [Solirubrobacterales bacterium]|nr:AMP-binding protein [Solirubrobacterales bacterium]